MTAGDLDLPAQESALRAARTDTAADAAALVRSIDAVRAARSDGTADDEHDPEGSTLTADWSQLVGLRAAATERAAAIERALERIGSGRYGACISCGQPIAPARLRARPAAETCIACAR